MASHSTSERVQAFAAGAAGALAMMGAARVLRSPVMRDLSELSGSLAAEPGSEASWWVGSATQLVNGGLLAQLYLAAFDRLGPRAGFCAGLGLGAMHGVVAGAVLGLVPALHHRVPEEVPAPGAFMQRRGARGAAVLVAVHALFGAIVGASVLRIGREHLPGRQRGTS